MEGHREPVRRANRHAHCSRTRRPPPRFATKVAKAEEKFVIKVGYVDGKALDAKGERPCGTSPARTSFGRLSLQLLLAAPQNFLALLHAAP